MKAAARVELSWDIKVEKRQEACHWPLKLKKKGAAAAGWREFGSHISSSVFNAVICTSCSEEEEAARREGEQSVRKLCSGKITEPDPRGVH